MAYLETVRRGRILHHVDGLNGRRLCGWAFRPREPRRRLWITAEAAGGQALGLADLYRADVHRANLGSEGYCGFAIALPGAPTTVRVSIAEAGRLRHLVTVSAEAGTPDRFETLGELRFALEASPTRLAGWLSSALDPDDRRRIILEVDGAVVASPVACLYRRRAPVGAGDGFHGFSIAVPAAGRELRLLDAASGQLLHLRRR